MPFDLDTMDVGTTGGAGGPPTLGGTQTPSWANSPYNGQAGAPTWGDIIRMAASSGQSQNAIPPPGQMQQFGTQAPNAQPLPVPSFPDDKKQDSTGMVVSLLLNWLGAAGG